MKIIELEQPMVGDIVEFITDPDTVVEGLIIAETEDGYIYEFSEPGYKELTESCTYGKYFCSTDKKYKCRQGPKQSRTTEAANAAQQAAIAISKKKQQDVKEGSREQVDPNTVWEVCFDYGPHQSDKVKVRASSQEEAEQKGIRAAKKLGHRFPQLNWAMPVEQDVTEGLWDRHQSIPELEQAIENLIMGYKGGTNLTDKGRAQLLLSINKGKRILAKKKQQQGVAEAEGEPEGLPHLTKELLKHIVDQIGTDGARAIVKSIEWGDGAAKELVQLIKHDLENNIELGESVKQRLDKSCWSGYKKSGTKMKGGVRVNNCVPESTVREAEYQGRTVPLGKPMAGDVKKSKVYVKNAQGNVVKVNFGDPNMRIKKTSPKHRKSFRARHNCENPGPRWKARYWSCRAW